MSNIDKQALRQLAVDAKELAIIKRYTKGIEAQKKFIAAMTPALVLALLDELEAAEERYDDMLRQARSFREAHDSASEIIRKLERNKPVVNLPTTKLWAGKVACYEASEIIELLSSVGIRIQGED